MQTQIKFQRLILVVFAGLLAIASCKKDSTDSASSNPQPNLIDPGEGAGGTVLTLTGNGLAQVQSIRFSNGDIPAPFNPNFNTDGAVIFRVPDAANVGDQNIVFTNAKGIEFSVPFKVLALVSVSSAFPMEFEAGNKITLTGNYFQTVDEVTIEGTSDHPTILSATATELVLEMPATSVKTARLSIHNNAGSRSTPMSFINMDLQSKLFTEDLGGGVQNWSWCAASVSSAFAVSGTKSFEAKYSAGGWQGLSFHTDTVVVTSNYQFLVFWIKGGTALTEIDIKADGVLTGSAPGTTISVPPNVWTRFSIPVAGTLGGVTCQRFNFQMRGPDGGVDETVYLDNVFFMN